MRRRRFELAEVHRIGGLGAGGDVGDLALIAGTAHRHGAGAVGDRIRAESDAVVGIGQRVGAQRRTAHARRGAEVTQRRAAEPARPGLRTHGGRVHALRVGEVARCRRAHAIGLRQRAHGGAEVAPGARARAERGGRVARRFGRDQEAQARHQIAEAADGGAAQPAGRGVRADRRRVLGARIGAVAQCGAVAARSGAEAAAGEAVGAGRLAAVTGRGGLQAFAGRGCAGGGAEGTAGMGARTQCRRPHFGGRRGAIKQHFTRVGMFVVQRAADGGAGIAFGHTVVAGRVRVGPPRRRTAAQRRCADAVRTAAGTDGGRVIGVGKGVGTRRGRVGALRIGVTVAGRAEVARVGRDGFELRQIHRVGRLRARGDIGDLALGTCTADRHGVLTVGDGIRAQRDAAGGGRIGQEADGRRILGTRDAAATQRAGAVFQCRGQRADGGGLDPERIGQGPDGRGADVGRTRTVAQRGRGDAAGLGGLQDEARQADQQVAIIGDATHGQAVVAAGHAAVAHRGGETAGCFGERAERARPIGHGTAAVTERRGLRALGGGGRAGRRAEGAAGLRTRAECRGTDFGRGGGLVEQYLAGVGIFVVQPAADGGAGVTFGDAVVARGVRVGAPRGGAAADRRGSGAVGAAARADGGRVIGRGVGIRARRGGVGAFGEGLAVAGATEILKVGGSLIELRHVHRIGVLGARGHVRDLPLAARTAHRHRARAIGHRTLAQRHRVVARGVREVAQCRAVESARARRAAHRRGVVARRHRRNQAPERATHRDAVVAGRLSIRTDRRGVEVARAGAEAHRRARLRQRLRAVAQCGRAEAIGHRVAAVGRRTVAVGFRAEAAGRGLQARGRRFLADRGRVRRVGARTRTQRDRAVVGCVSIRTQRQAALAPGFRVRPQRHRVHAGGHRVEADRRRGLLHGERAAAECRRAFGLRLRARTHRGRVVAFGERARAECGRVLTLRDRHAVAGRIEILVGLRGHVGHFVELAAVDRVIGIDAVGDVDDAARGRRTAGARAVAHRHRVRLVRDRAVAERDTVLGAALDDGRTTDGDAAGRQRLGVEADRSALRRAGARVGAERGGSGGLGVGARADGRRVAGGRAGIGAHGRGAGGRRLGAAADTDRIRAVRLRLAADGDRLRTAGARLAADGDGVRAAGLGRTVDHAVVDQRQPDGQAGAILADLDRLGDGGRGHGPEQQRTQRDAESALHRTDGPSATHPRAVAGGELRCDDQLAQRLVPDLAIDAVHRCLPSEIEKRLPGSRLRARNADGRFDDQLPTTGRSGSRSHRRWRRTPVKLNPPSTNA